MRGMSAQLSDAADAFGIAHMMCTFWFREAYIQTRDCCRVRLFLIHRRNLKRKLLDLENAIRHLLRAFGIRLGGTSRGACDQAVRDAVAANAQSAELK